MKPVSLPELLSVYLTHRKVCTDTRKIEPGDLYWALKGDRFDGNQFAHQALEAGAALAVVDDRSVIPKDHQQYVLVNDSLTALQQLAAAFRNTWTIPVLGLTGSNGKTTTKELIVAALSTQFRVHATAGNYNNHIGVPLTILACPEDAEIAVIEMGTNQPGDIRELADMAEPDTGLITNIGYAHIEKLLSLDGVMREKGQLFEVVKAKGGQLFFNAEDERLRASTAGYAQTKSFGLERGSIRSHILRQSSEGMTVQLIGQDWPEAIELNSRMSGRHNALNIAAAALVADYYGIEPAKIAAGIASYVPANHRSQLIDRGDYQIWMDAYNANPSSMAASIRHVMGLGAKRVALIIGDMKELGQQERALHRDLGLLIEELAPALVIGIGDLIQASLEVITTPTAHFSNTAGAESSIRELISDCDLILLKASRSIGLERLLEQI